MTSETAFDIETNGLDPDKVWCVGVEDKLFTSKEEFTQYVSNNPGVWYGHNSLGFDAPILSKLWDVDWADVQVHDTLVLSQLASPSREGGHSLESWGARLDYGKFEFHDFDKGYTPEMGEYCLRDVELLKRVKCVLDGELRGFDQKSIDLEHGIQRIIQQQIKNGWLLDHGLCYDLLAELKERKFELEDEVHQRFTPRCKFIKEVTPKIKQDGTMSVVGLKFFGDSCLDLVGGPLSRVDYPEFNLGSRRQIGEYLISFGWSPKKFTETGQPIVDETVLEKVEGIPEATLIANYLMVQKRIAQIQSWLEAADPETGRVHGYVNSNGAVTGRMTHSSPNVAQVPASYKPYGDKCRRAWCVPEGHKLVGMDADGLELRMLAHYMGDAAFTKAVCEGRQEDGTDIHTVNQRAAGLPTRNSAKTFIYAFLYGAGDAKIGSIIGGGAVEGAALKSRFLKRTPALKQLKERVETASGRGWLKGLDGRRIAIRSRHAALNTLLQGAGAVVMKQALVNLDRFARSNKLDYRFVGNIHDEIQTEVLEAHADKFGQLASLAVCKAGKDFNLKCPLSGSYQIGDTWEDTH